MRKLFTLIICISRIQDPTLQVSMHTIACKLVLNMVDIITRKSDSPGLGRQLLMHILAAFINKLGSLAEWQIPLCLRHCLSKDASPANCAAGGDGAAPMEGVEDDGEGLADAVSADALISCPMAEYPFDLSALAPLKTRQVSDVQPPALRDLRGLLKTLVGGLKNIIWGVNHCNQTSQVQANGNQPRPVRLLAADEVYLFVHLLRNGLRCFDIYKVSLNGRPRDLRVGTAAKLSSDEKETVETFASLFSGADVITFRDVFGSRIELLVAKIIENNLLLTIPQHILSYSQVSPYFGYSLLDYLLKNLTLLGGEDKNVSSVLLRLFKLVFGSVSLFADQNDSVLQPFLADIIARSLELAPSARDPINYFMLLRALFRSIGGGKFELLYKEFLPLLPALLTGLNRLQDSSHRQQMKDLFVELCLTVPVRLSSLLPYLHYLMKPLVLALNSNDELVSQGLRTLELCIDNLNPEFLNPIIDPVRVELMDALWRHLRPAVMGSPHGTVTLRILGKLGGKIYSDQERTKETKMRGRGGGGILWIL